MKKILFSLTVALGLFGSVNAQFPDGTFCPDFTGTDINGNTHNLYTYLDAGYTVIVDISATWCGPCWSYHQAGTLEDIWLNHGPAGGTGVSASTTDDVIVLWVEGDGSTGLAELNGSGNTQGDWVTGTDFPIIDDASIAQTLNIAYYPTLYTIYPDRYLEESGQSNTTYANISANIGNHTGSTGVDAGLFSYTGETVACGNLDVQVLVQNKGSQALNAGDITVNVSSGGSNIGSATNSTALAQWETETVTVPVSLSSAATITVEAVATGDVNNGNNSLSQAIGFATPGAGDLTFTLTLDQYPGETSWEFANSAGTVLASGSGYSTNYQVITETLPVASDDCYSVTIMDSYGDGLGGAQWGGTDGSWSIVDASGTTIASGSGDFGAENVDKMDMTASSGPSSINENGINELSIFPNPFSYNATISFNVEGLERTTIEVINTIGQNVQSFDLGVVSGNQMVQLDATELPAGFYLINIKSGNNTVTSRVTVNK
ncbi:MAG: hypothetical protein CL853_01555 [Crocinitomicaceae bacterium]|nr:hypothetical protein [Crocinitomicaceae bacterium]|tara:strand:+ start:112 stop:1581 length:1470 start_codon:yes stop_codon:yes gene_type:complete